jgi:glycosyltransferase involved in cell wall biosynthesis
MTPVPILILGDGPDHKTGLGRIGHDLAWLVSGMPEFEVGYLGRLAFGRSLYPWQQYSFGPHEQWGEGRLEEAWGDLSRGRKGIVLTVWDASRLMWLADPKAMPEGFQKFLARKEFEKWGYFMADGSGIRSEALPLEQACVVAKYDRVLMASKWAMGLAGNVTPAMDDLDWLPHGLNLESFQPVARDLARSMWGVAEADKVIGCVMTNQARKNWPVVLMAVGLMENAYLWVHTDTLTNYWDIAALAIECGMADRLFYHDKALTDRELAMRYSGCDATVVISGGEGFCYPAAESLACGCPVVAGSYGAQAELVGHAVCVPPVASVIDTIHNVRRAVYRPADVAKALEVVCRVDRESLIPVLRERVAHLDWPKLAIQWRKWLRSGLKGLASTS